jgi:hypothetical protein
MFRTVPLSIIRSFPLYTQQWYMSYTFAESLRAGSGRSQAVSKPVWYIPLLCTVKNSWWWTKELSETCRVLFQKQIWEISASGWFYYKNKIGILVIRQICYKTLFNIIMIFFYHCRVLQLLLRYKLFSLILWDCWELYGKFNHSPLWHHRSLQLIRECPREFIELRHIFLTSFCLQSTSSDKLQISFKIIKLYNLYIWNDVLKWSRSTY